MGKCVRCGNDENLIEYNKGLLRKDGTRKQYYICNPCNTARVKQSRTKNRIKFNEKRRKKYIVKIIPPFIIEKYEPKPLVKDDLFYTVLATNISEEDWRKQAKTSEERILKRFTSQP